MKTTASLLLLAATSAVVCGQGPITPPGAPGTTMKSLQEIWDKIGILEAQNAALAAQNNTILSRLNLLVENSQGGGIVEMIPVGNAGNAADGTGYGAVGYAYSIGKYEVTNAQYAQFLNAVAATDPNGLYNPDMGNNMRGGISRLGNSESYAYAVKADMGAKPVNFVNWYDAVRFCNWLHNGRPTGVQDATTTEGGAYTLTGVTSVGSGSDPIHGANGRNAGALHWLPSEDEWYKAAYHDPVNGGADANSTTDYWLYPTMSDAAPTSATADATGNIDNDVANIANYAVGADWNGQDGNLTSVGSGGAGSMSYYGAADMAGNLFEWNEGLIGDQQAYRGGYWNSYSSSLQSSFRLTLAPSTEGGDAIGFRVAGP